MWALPKEICAEATPVLCKGRGSVMMMMDGLSGVVRYAKKEEGIYGEVDGERQSQTEEACGRAWWTAERALIALAPD